LIFQYFKTFSVGLPAHIVSHFSLQHMIVSGRNIIIILTSANCITKV